MPICIRHFGIENAKCQFEETRCDHHQAWPPVRNVKADSLNRRGRSTQTVHYEGCLTDGTVFIALLERGSLIDLLVSGVILLVEAPTLMHVGLKIKLYIP